MMVVSRTIIFYAPAGYIVHTITAFAMAEAMPGTWIIAQNCGILVQGQEYYIK